MNKAPAFQLYASDFDMDTASWDNEEVGIYFRLLMYQWVNKSIPSDIHRLSKIARIGQKRFQNRWRIIAKKFQDNGNNELINPRMEKVRKEQDNYRESQSKAGKKGVEKKRKLGIFPFNDPSSDPSSDPASQNQALLSSSSIKNKDIDIPFKRPFNKPNKTFEHPDWLNLPLWKEFKKYRTKIKAPLTNHAEKLCLADLKKVMDEGFKQIEIVNQTIMSGKWKSFYPVKNKSREDKSTYKDMPKCSNCGQMASSIKKGEKCPFCRELV